MKLPLMKTVHAKSVLLGLVLGTALYKFWNLFRSSLFRSMKAHEDFYYDCLFFSPKLIKCSEHCGLLSIYDQQFKAFPCNFCNMNKLISLLDRAQSHLDICMYLITYERICSTIVQLLKKGVIVRVILDRNMSEDASGAKVLSLRKDHVPVQLIVSQTMMHNKFAVIDRKLVITGSINWTKQGFFGNYENVLIIEHKKIAEQYINYFELLWEMRQTV